MKRSIMVIIRPPADMKRLEPLQAAVDELRAAGHVVRPRLTWEPGDARRWARAAALRGVDVVVAAGGDGTVNEVVNGLAAATESDTTLAVVPLGTANDFARGLGLPEDPVEALRVAATGSPVGLDVIRVNRRCFVNVSTGGFAAEATRRASRGIKRFAGGLAYVIRGSQLLWTYQPQHAVFRADGRVIHEGPFAFFAVANAHLTGGGTPIAPRARPQDGLLDVTLVGDVSRLELLRLFPHIRAGTHLSRPDVIYARAHTFDVETRDEIAVNADGEPVAGRSFAFDVLPRELRIMTPSARATRKVT